MIKNKTYMIIHIPIKQMWLEEKYYIDKRCTKMVNKKMLKNPMKNNNLYNKTKDQNSKSG
jgi:hypothetical protein